MLSPKVQEITTNQFNGQKTIELKFKEKLQLRCESNGNPVPEVK